ncbi:unnamed protein product [Bemisia tabaci]|uniref:Uncharacterized protein n=1 Tax=Bemisia tabaci TaxID=7038 RepID=A0A9P0AGF2_BEMTA|nr:unnamed protein product [Bemisia tabaci]
MTLPDKLSALDVDYDVIFVSHDLTGSHDLTESVKSKGTECQNMLTHEPCTYDKSVVDRAHEFKTQIHGSSSPSSPLTSLALYNSNSFLRPSTHEKPSFSPISVALAEHAADDLRLQEKEDDKHFEPLKGVELEITPDIELEPFVAPPTAKPLRHVPEPKRPPLEAPKKSVLRVGGNTEDKENQEFIEAEQRPSIAEQRPSITEHRSSISEHRSSISERRPSITEHRPSIGEVVISESSKSVQEVRSSQYIQEEESKMSIRSVKTSEYRSVTSSVSEEVYMETSSNQMEQVASSTSSSSRSYKKMEHSVDGKTISHVEEISSTQGGYGDLSGGGGAIDRRQSLLSIQELVSARRSSQVDSLASSASSLFSKPIAGSAVEHDNAGGYLLGLILAGTHFALKLIYASIPPVSPVPPPPRTLPPPPPHPWGSFRGVSTFFSAPVSGSGLSPRGASPPSTRASGEWTAGLHVLEQCWMQFKEMKLIVFADDQTEEQKDCKCTQTHCN